MNGAELAHFIRARFPDVGVVLSTGYAEAATGMLAQDFPLVRKPYDQSSLVGAVARVLQPAQ
jgi:DNA-binding LytR/AlgR family response regulator